MNINSEIMDATWFTPIGGCIGLVAVKDKITSEVKFYIGYGFGADEKTDSEHIATYGAKVYPSSLIEFLGRNLDSK